MKLFRCFAVALTILAAVSCSNKGPQFLIQGKIADADTSVLYLEKRELNKITLLDSVKLGDTKGEFKFSQSITPYPEFYVLRLNGQVINLSVDSVETLTVNASKKTFATDYTVEGSDANNQLKKVVLAQYDANSKLVDLKKRFDEKSVNEQDYIAQVRIIADEYKTTAKKIIFENLKSPAAYFALFQKVSGYLFFDPYDRTDYKVFAAVATSWDMYYKDSPRSTQLHGYTLAAMKIRKQNEQTMEIDPNKVGQVDATEYYKIELPDVNGKTISLSSLKGKAVLLDFTVYQDENSPRHNIQLNKVYNKYKPNLEIYQVSLDSETHLWKNAAVNIPWIAVHDQKSVNSDLIFKYNVQGLPTIFLLNKEGEVVKRLLPSDNLETEIQKIL